MAPPRRTKSSKNPPILSHEFVIQNHADIVSCLAMVFIAGLMFKATNPVASFFIMMQHNVTVNDTSGKENVLFTSGRKDLFSFSFYFLICIVVHAVIQEYVLDRLNRKMHLSKIKHSKFNESGQLLIFFLSSALWGLDILFREKFITGVSRLWDYPHVYLPFIVKFFFIIQVSYWLHNYPELYFQKVRKEEIPSRLQYTTLYLGLITAAHFLNFHRVALCLLVLHYFAESVYHMAKLCHFSERLALAEKIFTVFDVLFVVVRLMTVTLVILTFWYGLAQSSQPQIDIASGNYNTFIIRINCLLAVCLSQAGLMWNFITFHLRKHREKFPTPPPKKLKSSPSKKKPSKSVSAEDLDSLPEVDQNSATENGNVRSRKGRK